MCCNLQIYHTNILNPTPLESKKSVFNLSSDENQYKLQSNIKQISLLYS